MKGRNIFRGAAFLAVALASIRVLAAAPEGITPVTAGEKEKLLAVESEEQKALSAELAKLAGQGQKIYFNANADGVQRVYEMGCDGSNVKCLTPAPGPGGQHPQVTPDGGRVTYSAPVTKEDASRFPPPGDGEKGRLEATKQGVFILDLKNEGGVPEPVAIAGEPRWSPDARRLTYMYKLGGRKRRVAIFDVEKKQEHPVNVPGISPGCYPAFIPDGSALFICGKKGALFDLDDDRLGPAKPVKTRKRAFSQGCNLEFSRDGKLVTWVVDTVHDTGGWLKYAPFDPENKVKAKSLPLGWDKKSVNYFPDFSTDGKYYVYAHADPQKGVKSWLLTTKQELYVTTFPDCKTTVRITWNGAANQHPQWWGPVK
jgi:hypothetical protein